MWKRAGCFCRERTAASYSLCDRMGRPGRGSCRARVAGFRNQGPRGARVAGGRFEGPHQEAQSRDSIREQSGQVDSRLAGPFGTTASVIRGPLRHERVCASWILFNQGLCFWKPSVRTSLVPRLPRLTRLLTFGSRGMRVPDHQLRRKCRSSILGSLSDRATPPTCGSFRKRLKPGYGMPIKFSTEFDSNVARLGIDAEHN